MNKRYSLVVIMILLSLFLGGCSLMTDQSTEKTRNDSNRRESEDESGN